MLVGRWPTFLTESWKSALFSRWYGVHGAFLVFLCWKWYSYRLETGVSGNLWSCPKEAKAIVLYDGEQGIALKPTQVNWSSFKLIWATLTISHSCGDISVLLDLWGTSGGPSVVPSRKSRVLTCLIGTKALLCTQCMGIGPHLSARRKFHGFLETQGGNLGYILELRQG